MTKPKDIKSRYEAKREREAQTTVAAKDAIEAERRASEAKVAKLRAMRQARARSPTN